MKKLLVFFIALTLPGCVSLTPPIYFSFSDGSNGNCNLLNKHGVWTTKIPGTVSVGKSDDILAFSCQTEDGRKTAGEFLNFGDLASITDNYKYQISYIIPIKQLQQEKPVVTKDTTLQPAPPHTATGSWDAPSPKAKIPD